MLLGCLGLRLGIRGQVYMASKVSSGLSGFLRLGVPCATPGSPLGGDGRLGTISAALALSSRNLSNSSLVTPSSPSSPCCWNTNTTSHLRVDCAKPKPLWTATKQSTIVSLWMCPKPPTTTPLHMFPHTHFFFFNKKPLTHHNHSPKIEKTHLENITQQLFP